MSKRHGLSRIGRTAMTPLSTASALNGPYSFEISAHDVVFRGRVLGELCHVLLAVEEVTQEMYAETGADTAEAMAAFLGRLIAEFPQKKIIAVRTNIDPAFTDLRGAFDEDMALFSDHPFAKACRANDVAHTRIFSASATSKTMPYKVKLRHVDIRTGPDTLILKW